MKNEKKHTFPMSFAQKRMYFMHQFMQDNQSLFNIPIALEINGALDLVRTKKTIDRIVEKHEILRTNFIDKDGGFFQVVNSLCDYNFDVIELNKNLDELINDALEINFNLSEGPLFKIFIYRENSLKVYILFIIHHIIFDGWSQSILTNEFAEIYLGYNYGVKSDLQIQYADYSVWENENFKSEKFKKMELYWSKKMENANISIDFPKTVLSHNRFLYEGRIYKFEIDEILKERIMEFCAISKVSVNNFLLSIYSIILSRYSNQEDIVIGCPVSNRRSTQVENLIGLFINTIPVRIILDDKDSFKDIIDQVSVTLVEALDNIELPLEYIIKNIDIDRDVSSFSLFDSLYVYQNMPKNKLLIDNLQIEGKEIDHIFNYYDISLTVFDIDKIFKFKVEYNNCAFTDAAIYRFSQHFINLIDAVLAKNCDNIHTVNFLTVDENDIYKKINNTKYIIPDYSIIDVFEEIVVKYPKKIALTHNNEFLTYEELNKKANQLCSYFVKSGLEPGNRVAILMHRSFDLIIGILAIIKARCAYIPIEVNQPINRINYMVSKSKCTLVLVDSDIMAIELCNVLNVKNVNVEKEGFENPTFKPIAEDLLYIIYTSGTTGTPKGIKITHAILVNLLYHQYLKSDIKFDTVLQFASIGFDVGTQEIFSTLCYGGNLVLIDESDKVDIDEFFQITRKNRIRTLFLPASYLKMISEDEKNLDLIPSCVDHVISAGEQLVITNHLEKKILNSQLSIYNHYGPAETHVVTNFIINSKTDIPMFPPIGTPIINREIYILNKYGGIQPVGYYGEISIGGKDVGVGYEGNEDLTNKRFINSPFKRNFKIYKTGDIGVLNPTGTLSFIGRNDSQVKINGQRVELQEIESVIRLLPNIKNAYVTNIKSNQGKNVIIAFYLSDFEITKKTIDNHLLGYLPKYMLPKSYILVNEIPLNKNGKVDKDKLLSIVSLIKTKRDNQIGSDKFSKIWCDILDAKLEDINLDDDFFDKGGDSLAAIRLVSLIRKDFSIRIDIKDVFNQSKFFMLKKFVNKSLVGNLHQSEVMKAPILQEYPVTFLQKQIWISHYVNNAIDPYNLIMLKCIKGDIKVEILTKALNLLIEKYSILRTSFLQKLDGSLIQIIHSNIKQEIIYNDISSLSTVEQHYYIEENRCFNLESPNLFIVKLFRMSSKLHIILLNIHHIICDLLSLRIFQKNLFELYDSLLNNRLNNVNVLKLQFVDYAYWESQSDKSIINSDKEFWKNKIIRSKIMPLNIKVEGIDYSGRTISRRITKLNTKRVFGICRSLKVTPYLYMISLLKISIFHNLGINDITITSLIANRIHQTFEDQIGVFLHLYPFISRIDGNMTLMEYCQSIKYLFLEYSTKCIYPIEHYLNEIDIIKKYKEIVDDNFFFIYQGENGNYESDNVSISNFEHSFMRSSAQFNTSIDAYVESNGELVVNLEVRNNIDCKIVFKIFDDFVRLINCNMSYSETLNKISNNLIK